MCAAGSKESRRSRELCIVVVDYFRASFLSFLFFVCQGASAGVVWPSECNVDVWVDMLLRWKSATRGFGLMRVIGNSAQAFFRIFKIENSFLVCFYNN